MSFTAPKFTNAGKELLSRALSGDCAVKFTSLALGSGELSSQAIAAMTGLISEQKRIGLEVYQRIDGETVNVRGTFNNSELAAGFHWREVGLFAQNPDDPDNRASDILYCYQNAGDLAEYIPSVNDEVMEKTISLTTKISDAAEVTAVLLSEVYPYREDFEKFQRDVEEGYVKKTGDTMTGDLAIMKPNSHIYMGHGDFSAGSAPTETKAATVEFKDANGKTIGVVQSVISPDGSGKLALWHADASGAKNGGILLVGTDKDGKPIFTHLDNAVLTVAGGKMKGWLDMSGNDLLNVGRMEMAPPTGEVHGGYIDFHFGGKSGDFTSRIMEDGEGHLQINAPNGTQFMAPIGSSAANAFQVSRNSGDIWSVVTSAEQFGYNLYYGIASSGYRGIYDGHTKKWLVAYSEQGVPMLDNAFAVKTVNGQDADAAGNVDGVGYPTEALIEYSLPNNTTFTNEYTAPANGYFTGAAIASNRNASIVLTNLSNGINSAGNVGEYAVGEIRVFVPAKKGQLVRIYCYHAGSPVTWYNFKFVHGG